MLDCRFRGSACGWVASQGSAAVERLTRISPKERLGECVIETGYASGVMKISHEDESPSATESSGS